MIRQTLIPVLFAGAATAFVAAPADAVTTYTVPAKKVTEIETSCGLKVIYRQASETSVSVSTPEETKPYLRVTVDYNGTLNATLVNNRPKKIKGKNVVITVTAPMVTDFEASSAAKIECPEMINAAGKKIDIEASSAAAIKMAGVKAASLDCESSSAASITISSASVNDIDAEISSAANLNIANISGDKLNVEASSASNAIFSGTVEYANLEATSMAIINVPKLKAKNLSIDKNSGGSVYKH